MALALLVTALLTMTAMAVRTRRLALLAPLVLVVGLTACGGSDSTAKSASTKSTGSAPMTKSIVIKDFAFSPVSATVKKGATLTVTNKDGATHSLTADDKSFDTGKFSSGTKTITLDKAGSFSYHCEIHSYMKGTIVVTQ